MDLIKVADILVEKIKRDYKDDVAIVCLCGSYVHKATHALSDLDFYFIPKTPRGFEMFRDFIIGDISFDFWPLPWEGVEHFAHYGDRRVSIIADGQVVYYASEDDLARFKKLQELARHPGQDVNFSARVTALMYEIDACYLAVLQNKDDFTSAKSSAIHLLWTAGDAIAALNHTYVRRGWGKVIQEIEAMQTVPENFGALYTAVLYADNLKKVKETATVFLESVKKVLEPEKGPVNIKEVFHFFYEEAKSSYNKVYHACDTGDAITAALAGASLQQEITGCLGGVGYTKTGLPDLVTSFSPEDLAGYKKMVAEHEKQFLRFLDANEIKITRYKDIEEFTKALMK